MPHIQSSISLKNVSLAFPGRPGDVEQRWAVRGIQFEIPEGQFCSIVGPSGCGKSTLLSIVAGLLQPTGGNAFVNGQAVQGIDPRIGYMFQKDTLVPWRTAVENVLMPLEIAGRSDRAVAASLLAKVGLAGFERHYPRELSGGMRKRVQLARLLAQTPETLLLDEPFGALDAQTKLIIHEEFLRIWEKSRQTVLFVTHDLAEAILLSDRILLVSPAPGQIQASYEVPISRPRDIGSVMETPVFRQLFREIWTALREGQADKTAMAS